MISVFENEKNPRTVLSILQNYCNFLFSHPFILFSHSYDVVEQDCLLLWQGLPFVLLV